jgi:hypothetical protein
MEVEMKTVFVTIVAMIAGLITAGCDNNDCVTCSDRIIYVYDEDVPPPVPQGVYSITRDHEVLLYWLPVDDVNGDFDMYVVYRSDFADTGYWEIGRTTVESFMDDSVTNGHKYYYAVSSMDVDGNLSDLSYEYVFDTPRPQGTNRALFDYNVLPGYAGYAFANDSIVDYQSPFCDIYLEYFSGDDVYYFNVANISTDIQDMGYTADFDEISYAPLYGWSHNGWCEVILNHTYVIWTADNHFAKVRVTAINSQNVIFDWAYQVAIGNPELKPVAKRSADYLRHPLP